jgi:8-amino-7-oxononanoate synthase
MSPWRKALQDELDQLRAQALLRLLSPASHEGRFIRVSNRQHINLASNDYLALASDPRVISAGIQALESLGAGAGASRLVTGHTPAHASCEAAFASFKHAQGALLFPSGYMANLAAITALASQEDLILSDKANHASLLDAARFTGATHRVFPHLNYDKLARLLESHAKNHRRTLIITDSVFSMDGDTANLPLLTELSQKHDAILIIDEAHATGVLGPTGAGLAELQNVSDLIPVSISTASKALGLVGGIVTGPDLIIQTLINKARPFIYTTGLPPSTASMITCALTIVRGEPQRRERLTALSAAARAGIDALDKFPKVTVPAGQAITPIIPVTVGSAQNALHLAAHLADHGIHAPAIRPPTVAPGASRVRLSLRSDLLDADLDQLFTALKSWQPPALSPLPLVEG